ncbi:MAG TPA: polysaccharide deacetylase family protein [Streptosporangiaceae bacterium]|jgi:peptidoglycan/xylan/chitin deacetylase (PgdA/CDA1 family)
MRRAARAAAALLACLAGVTLALPAGPALASHHRAGPPPATARPARTIVTFAWGGGLASQMAAMPILRRYGMRATYFVPSGLVCMQAAAQCKATSPYLTIGDVRALAAGGNEIGGLSLLHLQLASLPAAEAKREICDDRANLLRWGFEPADFAYPFATVTARMERLTRQCGYNSGLGTGQLRGAGLCRTCGFAETTPPADRYDLRTPIEVNSVGTSWTAGTYQSIVRAAQAHGGGWVIFTIHGVCPRTCALGVTPGMLTQVVSWLRGQQAHGVVVRTIRQVVGGPLRPAVRGPAPRPFPPPGIANAQLKARSGSGAPACFQQAVYGGTAATFGYDPAGGPHGGPAETVRITRIGHGNAKLLPALDLGQCAPQVRPGRGYRAALWYKSDRPVQLELYYRNAAGAWSYWTTSTTFPATAGWRQAAWTTPKTPPGATAVSFGLTARTAATITTTGYSLAPAKSHAMPLLLGALAFLLVAGALIGRGQYRYVKYARAEQAEQEQQEQDRMRLA